MVPLGERPADVRESEMCDEVCIQGSPSGTFSFFCPGFEISVLKIEQESQCCLVKVPSGP